MAAQEKNQTITTTTKKKAQDFIVQTTIWSDDQSLPGKYTVTCVNLTCWKAERQKHTELQILVSTMQPFLMF